MSKLISVIIPSYNRGDLLPRAVQSVIMQDYRPLEILIVDDGSTDDTPEKIHEMLKVNEASDVTFRAIFQKNAGPGAARNTGVDAASGDLLTFLDDDDYMLPQKLSKQAVRLDETDTQACVCLVQKISEDGELCGTKPGSEKSLPEGRDIVEIMSGRHATQITSLLFKKEVVNTVGKFLERVFLCEDTEWVMRLGHYVSFCKVGEPLVAYVKHSISLTKTTSWTREVSGQEDVWKCALHLKNECDKLQTWQEDGWRNYFSKVLCEKVKNYLWRLDFKGANIQIKRIKETFGETEQLKNIRKRYRKYRLLSLIGYPLKKDKWSD